MARIGMRHLVWAPITTETAGAAIVYGTGVKLGRAVSGNLSWERNDNPLYGDDVIAENDNGATGYTLTVGMTELVENAAATVLGHTVVEATTGQNATPATYEETDASAPYGGIGYVQVLKRNGVQKYKAIWYHKVQFAVTSEESQTKGQSIEWGTPEMEGTGFGVYNDASGKAKFRISAVFDTGAAAEAWLDGKANISSSSGGT